MSRVEDLYARARRALADGDAASWDAAEAMTELYNRGETQRAIAERLGCSQGTVSDYVAVFLDQGLIKKRPPFSEARAAIRPRNVGSRVPKSPEGKAALAADLLRDKRVADAPVVRKQTDRNADRRLRSDVAAFNKDVGIKTRTEASREAKRLSVVQSNWSWMLMLSTVKTATRHLAEATGEVERTGLPVSGSGEIIKATRALVRAAERFEKAAAEAGIGKAM